MNILRRVSVTLALVVVLFSIPTLARKVETDYDHTVNLQIDTKGGGTWLH